MPFNKILDKYRKHSFSERAKGDRFEGLMKTQKDTIIYNSKITITNIPQKAYEYVVNGKSAIEWIMERYQIKTHKDSGIKK